MIYQKKTSHAKAITIFTSRNLCPQVRQKSTEIYSLTSEKRSCADSEWTIVLHACLTISSTERPGDSASQLVHNAPIEPLTSTTQHTSVGGRTPVSGGTTLCEKIEKCDGEIWERNTIHMPFCSRRKHTHNNLLQRNPLLQQTIIRT
jgi:hypothetical protein